MGEILNLIRDRKWDTLIIIGLVTVLGIVLPMATSYTVEKTVEGSMQPITDSIKNIEDRITEMEEIQYHQVLESGIAGYKKISGNVEKLETSTQNSAAIKLALSIPRVRDILFAMDRDATILYEEYFKINS